MTLEEAITAARESRAAFYEAKRQGASELPEIGRTFFSDLARVFEFYAASKNWPSQRLHADERWPEIDYGAPHVALPPDLANAAWVLFGHVATGDLPEPINDCLIRRGRKRFRPMEERDIKTAVAFVLAARSGEIESADELREVCEAFDVKLRTAQHWVATFKDHDLSTARPHDRSLDLAMRQSGERYQLGGRSHAAVDSRGRRPIAQAKV